MVAEAARLLSHPKRWPLPARRAYGLLRRTFFADPILDQPEFRTYYNWLRVTEWWSREELEALQLTQLRQLLHHAYDNVTYYHEQFDRLGLHPEDFRSLSDLQYLPLVTKDELRSRTDDFVARNADSARLRPVNTGGSTPPGPMRLYHDDATVDLHEDAFQLRQWTIAGYRRGDRLVTLKGSVINRPSATGSKAWWDYNTFSNEITLSPFDMTEPRMFEYVALLHQFRPQFISAHPRSLEIICRFMRRHDLTLPGVQAAFCESETLYPDQRRLIEEQLGCPIFAAYGMTERVADAVECDRHRGYHVNMEYGILELVDPDGRPITEPGVTGQVVGTGLDTYCMPLIRYLTDDLAQYAEGECDCGRHTPLIRDFTGKVHQYIVARNGRLLPLFFGHGPIWDRIREWRFRQEVPGHLVVEVVPAPGHSQAEIETALKTEMFRRLNPSEFDVDVTFVASLPRTHRGKLGLLEQKIPIDFERPGGSSAEAIDGAAH